MTVAVGDIPHTERCQSSHWLLALFLLFCFFPYLRTIPLPVDTQPTGLVLGLMLIMLARRHQASAGVWMVAGITIAAIIIFLAGDIELSAIRNIIGYISLFVFTYLFFNISLSERALLQKITEIAILGWFLVGVLQIIIGRGFLVFLISDARTTDSRGVTSLAPEPTYYASQMLFLLLLHILLGMKRFIVAIALLSILFLAISSQVVIVIILATGISLPFLLGRRGFGFVLLISLFVGALGFALFEDYKHQYRILTIVDILLKNPTSLLLVDASANERFAAIYVSFKSFFGNYMMPHGISGNYYYDVFVDLKQRNPQFLWAATPSKSNLSGAGRIAFELGPLLFMFAGIVVAAAWRLKAPASVRVFTAAAYLLLMITAIPLAHPMVGAVLGVMIACGFPLKSQDESNPSQAIVKL
ncbi:hypothetical protein [Niveispirillum sp. BGYR6]|uniref:hypothetical protein n=1 Tax=Niveispirillum sp. BGYR6 TaxID=2971249 RepID=UPI0022B981CF|nr:hypothetical protein [Niveispirillum sp. BGYR6]MDG5496505.1 hypothetical protein [Niveispirillum sp. BGYR6]